MRHFFVGLLGAAMSCGALAAAEQPIFSAKEVVLGQSTFEIRGDETDRELLAIPVKIADENGSVAIERFLSKVQKAEARLEELKKELSETEDEYEVYYLKKKIKHKEKDLKKLHLILMNYEFIRS